MGPYAPESRRLLGSMLQRADALSQPTETGTGHPCPRQPETVVTGRTIPRRPAAGPPLL